MSKSLDLKVTVEGTDPDGALAKINKEVMRLFVVSDFLAGGTYSLKVTKVGRADGQPFGLDAEFEAWWADNHCEGDETDDVDKEWARDAFLYGAKIGKEKSRSA